MKVIISVVMGAQSDLVTLEEAIALLKEFGVDTNKNTSNCPFHSSKGGKCLSFTEDGFLLSGTLAD